MDTLKVIIENWPKTNYLTVYVPIIIALIAIGVSLYNVYLTRKSFIMSHRPYVWGINYGVIDHDKKTIIPIPSKLFYRVKNSPAKIIRTNVKISLPNEIFIDHSADNFVRFPDEKSEWTFEIGKEKFDQIMNRSDEDKSKLLRFISIQYSSLDGGKIYNYELKQEFIPIDNQWRDISEEAD
jgi:hypothetical protein